MTLLNKILLIIIGVLVVSAGGFIAYQKYMFDKQTVQMQNSVIEMQHLKDDIVRSQSQFVNQKGFEDFVKQNQVNLDEINKNIKSLGGQISAINVVQANSTGQNTTNVPSTVVVNPPTPTPVPKIICDGKEIGCIQDPFQYFSTTQTLKLSEDFGKVQVPIGEVRFDAGNKDNKPWGYTILPRQYKIDNTIAYTANGEALVYNALTVRSGDENFTIPITSSNTVQKFPESSFSFWSPKMYLGLSGTASFTGAMVKGEATPILGVSLMSYGKTTTNPDIRVLGIGVGYNMLERKPAAELTPISFNVGKAVSGTLLTNTYVGPVLGVNIAGSFNVGLGLQVGL